MEREGERGVGRGELVFFITQNHPSPSPPPFPLSIAFFKAANVFNGLKEDLPAGAEGLAAVKAMQKAKELPGVGKGILAKLEEYFETGTCTALQEVAGPAVPVKSEALAFA